jgi:hypothetical protein
MIDDHGGLDVPLIKRSGGNPRIVPTTALFRGVARVRAIARAHPMGRDITLAVSVKLLLLGALQAAFFSHPSAPNMKLPPEQVASAIFATAPAAEERKP